ARRADRRHGGGGAREPHGADRRDRARARPHGAVHRARHGCRVRRRRPHRGPPRGARDRRRRAGRRARGPSGAGRLSRRGRLMLEVRGLHAVYGRSHVLHGVSLEAREGEVVSLLGRNGAGKSTTLKAIMGLVRVTGGSVHFRGEPLTELATHVISRRGLGYVPEDRRIFADLTVRENLLVGERAGSRWTAERLFGLFPALRSLAERRGGSLSGGEQQ